MPGQQPGTQRAGTPSGHVLEVGSPAVEVEGGNPPIGDMMTVIKASCPICGDVELTPREVRLVTSNLPERAYYSFYCDGCGDLVRKPAGEEVIRLLTVGGVVAEHLHVPAEALEEHRGPAISWDDVIDFSAWLDTATTIVEAAAVAPG